MNRLTPWYILLMFVFCVAFSIPTVSQALGLPIGSWWLFFTFKIIEVGIIFYFFIQLILLSETEYYKRGYTKGFNEGYNRAIKEATEIVIEELGILKEPEDVEEATDYFPHDTYNTSLDKKLI